ncbi:MAG: GNAT family N-acetyltransferase [Burkholderiales bacterium]|nr:GNAT family N-acetyltransferase [Burkholderiales bacterium]
MEAITTAFSEALLSRIEDAGLNASAPPQQRWIDGWLVRFSPGKAKRARCINAVADGRTPLDTRLDASIAVLRGAGLPVFVRMTPFSRPAGLDRVLEQRGFHRIDDTRVMVCTELPAAPRLAPELVLESSSHAQFAELVGELRGSPIGHRLAHAERLALSPVPYQGWVLRRRDDGATVACGQFACEGDLVGLYDVFTVTEQRGRGLAQRLCAAMLAQARSGGARVAYLQVDSTNDPARAAYRRLGFADGYAYHYRSPDADAH